MRFNLETTFLDKMGLQWEIKLCNPNGIIIDEEGWMRIRQLWYRVLESTNSKPDGERINFGYLLGALGKLVGGLSAFPTEV